MINILLSILKNIQYSFCLSGRTNRKSFIVFFIFFQIYAHILYYLVNLPLETKSNFDKFLVISIGILSIFGLVLIFSLFSSIVRRLHDLNTSAWWLLITFIPFGVLLFFALPFKKGTPTANKYGEPPVN